MGDVGCNIDSTRAALKCVQIFGERFPIPSHPLGKRSTRNVLDTFHQTNQPVMLVFLCRGKANTAIAHDDRGDAMPAGWGHLAVPRRLAIIMGVDVDKAWRDNLASRINLFAALRTDCTNGRNDAAVYSNIRNKARCACAIDNGSTTNNQIMHADSPLSSHAAYQV